MASQRRDRQAWLAQRRGALPPLRGIHLCSQIWHSKTSTVFTIVAVTVFAMPRVSKTSDRLVKGKSGTGKIPRQNGFS
jgi:hypothetical protein